MGPSELGTDPSSAKAFDCLRVEGLGLFIFAEQPLRSGLNTKRPIGAARNGHLGELWIDVCGFGGSATPCCGLNELRDSPDYEYKLPGVVDGTLSCG